MMPLNIPGHAPVNLELFFVLINSVAIKIISTLSSKRGNRAEYICFILHLSMWTCDEVATCPGFTSPLPGQDTKTAGTQTKSHVTMSAG